MRAGRGRRARPAAAPRGARARRHRGRHPAAVASLAGRRRRRPARAARQRDWRRTIDAVDERIAQAIADGLFAVDGERVVAVADEFDSGPEFLDVVGGWRGTLIPASLAERAASARPPVRVIQDVRLRTFRVLGT
jgi:hypothetical protein